MLFPEFQRVCSTVYRKSNIILLMLMTIVLSASPIRAAAPEPVKIQINDEVVVAPVQVDGVTLFTVRGIAACPAKKRASAISKKIILLAQDENFDPETLSIVEEEDGTAIMGGAYRVVLVHDGDAALENASRNILANGFRKHIQQAIVSYRKSRTLAAPGLSTIRLANFEQDWAWPTYRLIRSVI